jgi:hypothetical protein
VRNAAAARQRMLKLQTGLGRALMGSRGYVAEESKAAFIRARELAAAVDNPTERLNIYHGLWLGNLTRGELGLARARSVRVATTSSDARASTRVISLRRRRIQLRR